MKIVTVSPYKLLRRMTAKELKLFETFTLTNHYKGKVFKVCYTTKDKSIKLNGCKFLISNPLNLRKVLGLNITELKHFLFKNRHLSEIKTSKLTILVESKEEIKPRLVSKSRYMDGLEYQLYRVKEAIQFETSKVALARLKSIYTKLWNLQQKALNKKSA